MAKIPISILIIDDQNQNSSITRLKTSLNKKFDLDIHQIQTTVPELRKEQSDHLDIIKLKSKIEEVIKDKSITLALTDFDLSENEEGIDGLSVVKILKELRPTIKIMVYSGNRTKVIQRVLNKQNSPYNEEEVIRAIEALMGYEVLNYIARQSYVDEIIKFANKLKTVQPKDYLIKILRAHHSRVFKSCYPDFRDKTFGEIADILESNSDARSELWMQELIEQSVAYLIEINKDA